MRRITLFMICGILILIVAFVGILYSAYDFKWDKIKPDLAPLLLGFSQVLFAIMLMWYNFSRNPELHIFGPHIQPERDGNIIALEQFIHTIRFADKTVTVVRPDTSGIWFWKKNIIRCAGMPSNLRFLFDIGNIGFTGVTLHEYFLHQPNGNERYPARIIALLEPSSFHLKEYSRMANNVSRVYHLERTHLRPFERTTNAFDFPWDGSQLREGTYNLVISVFAGTTVKPKAKKSVHVHIKQQDSEIMISWSI